MHILCSIPSEGINRAAELNTDYESTGMSVEFYVIRATIELRTIVARYQGVQSSI